MIYDKNNRRFFCFNNPSKNNIQAYSIRNLNNGLVLYSSTNENNIIMGYFNVDIESYFMQNIYYNCDLVNRIKEPSCFKNQENPT